MRVSEARRRARRILLAAVALSAAGLAAYVLL